MKTHGVNRDKGWCWEQRPGKETFFQTGETLGVWRDSMSAGNISDGRSLWNTDGGHTLISRDLQ